jgi:hypothetical protein
MRIVSKNAIARNQETTERWPKLSKKLPKPIAVIVISLRITLRLHIARRLALRAHNLLFLHTHDTQTWYKVPAVLHEEHSTH